MVEKDLVEAVVLLPENLFYNTSAPGMVMVLNRNKRHPGEILLLNASSLFLKGRPKNYLTDEHIAQAGELYHGWKGEEGLSVVVTTQQVNENDFNLSPSRYVAAVSNGEAMTLEEAVARLKEAEAERASADEELWKVLGELGMG
jgi:type I restriction enzyme M protein